MSRENDIKKLLVNYNRRLQALKERQALYGLDTPIAVLTEIENIEAEIMNLKVELEAITTVLTDREPIQPRLATGPSGGADSHFTGMPQFDVPTAQQCAREGRLEEWVHTYLNRPDKRANLGLSVGLQMKKRWWNGPLEIKLTDLNRCTGPEDYMEYKVDPYDWTRHTTEMAKTFTQPLDIPPLIVHCGTGFFLSIRDGNARHEAMRLKGWQRCWVIIWYDTVQDYRRHTRHLLKAGYLTDQGRA